MYCQILAKHNIIILSLRKQSHFSSEILDLFDIHMLSPMDVMEMPGEYLQVFSYLMYTIIIYMKYSILITLVLNNDVCLYKYNSVGIQVIL